MDVIICPTADAAEKLTARIFADEIRENPKQVLGLATGRTMEPVYAELVRMHRQEGLDFSKCVSFNLDEYAGLPPESEFSYRYYMNFHLFSHINIDLDKTHVPDGMAKDMNVACQEYEAKMKVAGGVDCQLLGMGQDGHIAFNEPLSSFASRTREVGLNPETIEQNAHLAGGYDRIPRRAVTMGVGTIMEAKQLLMLVTGSKKAEVVAKAIEGPITSMISSTALQWHPDAVVILDEAASARLALREHHKWLWETEPRWAKYR